MPPTIQSVFRDLLVGAALTVLTSHTPDLGAAYTGRTHTGSWAAGITNTKLDGAGFLVNANSNSSIIEEIASAVSLQNCEVSFTVTATGAISGSGAFQVNARAGETLGYTVGYHGDQTWKLWRYGPSAATVFQYSDNIGIGETRQVTMLVRNRAADVLILVIIDGVIRMQVVDDHANRQTAAGELRMRFAGMPNIKVGPIGARNFPATQTLTAGTVYDADAAYRALSNSSTIKSSVPGQLATLRFRNDFDGTWTQPDAATYPNVWSQALSSAFPMALLYRNGNLMDMVSGATFAAIAATLNSTTSGGYVDADGETAYIQSATDPNGTTYSHSRFFDFGSAGDGDGGVCIMADNVTLRDLEIYGTGKKHVTSNAADNGYPVGEGPGVGSWSAYNCHFYGGGKHVAGSTLDKANTTVLFKDCSFNAVAPFNTSNPSTLIAIYMAVKLANTGNVITIDGGTFNRNTELVGSSSGISDPDRTDIVIHTDGVAGDPPYDEINLLNLPLRGKIVQSHETTALLMISGCLYSSCELVANYCQNGKLSITSRTSSSVTLAWTAADSDFDDVTDQLQYRAVGATDWTDITGATSSPFTHEDLWGGLFGTARTNNEYRVKHDDGTHTFYSNVVNANPSASSASSGRASVGMSAAFAAAASA